MKGNRNVYRPLMEIINDALGDVQAGMHWQRQFTRWGMKYAEELHFDFLKDVRTVQLNFKPWKAIELPDDCLDWIAVGIQDGDDIKTFVKEEHMATLFTKDANNVNIANAAPKYECNVSQLPYYSDYMFPWLNLTALGEDPGQQYGLAVHDNGFGYVKENQNKDSNELIFKGFNFDLTAKCYLMYLSNLWEPNVEAFIHPFHAEYIVAGINKEYHKEHKGSTDTQRDMAVKEFDRQYLKVIDRNWDMTVEDILEYMKRGYKMTPKIG